MSIRDQAGFEKVAVANSCYKAPVEDMGHMVANWFDKPAHDEDEQIKEVEIHDGVYSSRETLHDLMNNEVKIKLSSTY